MGKHAVSFLLPVTEQAEWDGYGKPPETKMSPYANLVPEVAEFEVKPGDNDLLIELVINRTQNY